MLPPIKLCASKSDRKKVDDQKHAPKAKMLSPITPCAHDQKHVSKVKMPSPVKLCASKSDQQKVGDQKHVPKAKVLSPIRLCASKSDIQKAKNQKNVVKVNRNWLDLPPDLTANILQRIGVVDILENAQKVCTSWHKISKDPAMYRVIHMAHSPGSPTILQLREMCKRAVDRSQGQVVDIKLVDLAIDDVLEYISNRASNLKRLEIAYWYSNKDEHYTEALIKISACLKKFTSLEELSFHQAGISDYNVETLGRHCPLLKILKVTIDPPRHVDVDDESCDDFSKAIGKNLHGLRHLELIGDALSNIGLKGILDGCCHLESLDIRKCFNIDFQADPDLEKRCSQQIKHLKLPHASLEGYPYISSDGCVPPASLESPFIWGYESHDGCPFADLCAQLGIECGHHLSDSDEDYGID